MATIADIQRDQRTKTLNEISPKFPDIQELAKLVPAGAELIPGLEQLAGGVDEATQDQQFAIMERALPGITDQFRVASGQVGQQLRGQLPQDVIDFIQTNNAAQSLTGGVAGSGFSGNQFANALGLSSLDMVGQGIARMLGLTQGAQQAFGVPRFDISSEIPGLTDIYNQRTSEELSRTQAALALLGLDVAREGARAGGSGGGGGGGSSFSQGMPDFSQFASTRPFSSAPVGNNFNNAAANVNTFGTRPEGTPVPKAFTSPGLVTASDQFIL